MDSCLQVFTLQRLTQSSSKSEKAKKHRIFIYEHFSKATVELKKEVVLRRSFTVLAAKQNSIFKLQKHSCQIPCCKIVCLLLLLMSIYLYFLQVFNTTWIQIHNRNTRIWFSELWNFEVQHSNMKMETKTRLIRIRGNFTGRANSHEIFLFSQLL